MRERIEALLGFPTRQLVDRHVPRPRAPAAADPRGRRGPRRRLPDHGLGRPGAPGPPDAARARDRRERLGAEGGRVVHQRAEGRGPAAQGPARRGQRGPAPDDRSLRALRAGVRGGEPCRLRRAADSLARAAARQRAPAAPVPRPVQARARRRVPGYERDPVPLAQADRGARRRAVRRRRRRSVDLPLARRARRESAALPAGLSGHADRAARAELPLDREHSERGQRRDREQLRAARQDALDRGRRGRADQALRRVQRARRGGVRDQPDPGLHRHRAARAARSPCCTARTRSPACSRRGCSRPGFRTASTGACDSSSARKSRTRSRTCGSSRTATTTRRSSAS